MVSFAPRLLQCLVLETAIISLCFSTAAIAWSNAGCCRPYGSLPALSRQYRSCFVVHQTIGRRPVGNRGGGNGALLYLSSPGADIEQPPVLAAEGQASDIPMTSAAAATLTAPSTTTTVLRGNVNEIDYCIAPADVSLSRAYRTAADISSSLLGSNSADSKGDTTTTVTATAASLVGGLSLTRALNNASNRAVRRILLARSWPSATALNASLRKVMAQTAAAVAASASTKKATKGTSTTSTSKSTAPQQRTDAEYVADQLAAFSSAYGTLPGYATAQDYLQLQ
jgi:hypothetical protein